MNAHLNLLLSNVYGDDLVPDHRADLRKSGITIATIRDQRKDNLSATDQRSPREGEPIRDHARSTALGAGGPGRTTTLDDIVEKVVEDALRNSPRSRGAPRPEYRPCSSPARIRPQNGTEMSSPAGPDGLGSLRVRNGTTQDAVVKIIIDDRAQQAVRMVYVRAGNEITASRIGAARYRVRFALGMEWDPGEQRFLCGARYQEFVQPLTFEERETFDRTMFKKYELTLHPVPFGNARTKVIDEDEFRGSSRPSARQEAGR